MYACNQNVSLMRSCSTERGKRTWAAMMSMKWLPLNLGTTGRIHANKPANESKRCKVPNQIRAVMISVSKAWPETAIKRGGSTVK